MNNKERKAFWDALCNIRDNAPEHVQDLIATMKMPEALCRFRSVNERSLAQLQENKLYYSSADYYDDPFDTFIHVDMARIKEWHAAISDQINSDNPVFLGWLKKLEPITGVSGEQFLNNLKEYPLDLSVFPDRIKQVRTVIQRNLFSICFCENALNETLWLKYAESYSGFAMVYDIKNENTFLCGKEGTCINCRSSIEHPSIYPVYYTDAPYDATLFAFACLLWGAQVSPQFLEFSYKVVMWEAERVSLIKKMCHEYDGEWRMIRPTMAPDRTCIKMRPQKVILGLRMPEYERLLVVSAAKIAGINIIEELYIDDSDQLATRPFA